MRRYWCVASIFKLASASGKWVHPRPTSLTSDSDFSANGVHPVDSNIALQWNGFGNGSAVDLRITQQSDDGFSQCLTCGIPVSAPLIWEVSNVREMFSSFGDPLDFVFFFTTSDGVISVRSQSINVTEIASPAMEENALQSAHNKRAFRRRKGLSEQMKWCIGLVVGIGGGLILGMGLVYLYKWSMERQGRPVVWPETLPYDGS